MEVSIDDFDFCCFGLSNFNDILARGAYYFTYAKPGTAKELYFGFRSAPTLDMLFSITAFLLYL
jgi:hypothetical protein